MEYIKTSDLLKYNIDRYDTFVRLLFLKNHNNWAIYKKMQILRTKFNNKKPYHKYIRDFIKLENKFVNNNEIKPLTVNKNYKLLDGSHRFCLIIHNNIDKIPIQFKKENPKPYEKEWFVNNDFTHDEINMIDNMKSEIMNKYNLKIFSGFLWNPVYEKWDDILNEFFIIVHKSVHNLTENKLIDIYKTDDVKISKIRNVKWKFLSKYGEQNNVNEKKFLYFQFVHEPNYRKKKNGNLICQNVEKIKKNIRQKYKSHVDNYIYDVIIHICDNEDQNQKIEKIMINL